MKAFVIGASVMRDLARVDTGWEEQGCCQKPEEWSDRTGNTTRAQDLVCLDNISQMLTQSLFQTGSG